MRKKYIVFLITLILLFSGCSVVDKNDADGYYSLVDEGYATTIKSQVGGTCWVNAASTSMESSYKLLNEKEINIEPLEILECVQGGDKQEGFFIKDGVDGKELGGWAWQITETLSNGFGKYTLVESADYSNATIEQMKFAIKQYGGMNVAVNDTSNRKGMHDGYMTMNDPDSDSFDHEVVLVGWDDDFPKERFSKEASRDGAWLAQNSLSDAWGNDGYYWISYDTPFREQTVFVLSDEYQKVLSYDGGKENTIQTNEETVVANVFHSKGQLSAVGTYATAENQSAIIEIRDVEMKQVVYTQEVVFEYPGYHVVQLEETLDVEDYAVVIRFEGSAPVEGEAWSDEYVEYRVKANQGESYVLIEGAWKDLSDDETVKMLSLDFIPNNCCIKALYVE